MKPTEEFGTARNFVLQKQSFPASLLVSFRLIANGPRKREVPDQSARRALIMTRVISRTPAIFDPTNPLVRLTLTLLRCGSLAFLHR